MIKLIISLYTYISVKDCFLIFNISFTESRTAHRRYTNTSWPATKPVQRPRQIPPGKDRNTSKLGEIMLSEYPHQNDMIARTVSAVQLWVCRH
jgi:hypothetical protein